MLLLAVPSCRSVPDPGRCFPFKSVPDLSCCFPSGPCLISAAASLCAAQFKGTTSANRANMTLSLEINNGEHIVVE